MIGRPRPFPNALQPPAVRVNLEVDPIGARLVVREGGRGEHRRLPQPLVRQRTSTRGRHRAEPSSWTGNTAYLVTGVIGVY